MELIDNFENESEKFAGLREKAVGEEKSVDEDSVSKQDEEESKEGDDENNSEEDLTIDSDKDLTDLERVQLYEKGMKFKMKKSYKHALLCFLGCLKGIQQKTAFTMLPNCLQNIASIYAKFEDFPKAVQFMQAAKLYYETALIGTQGDEDEDYQTMDENAIEADAKRANDYEKLSHDCLMKKNIQLALEYCGKATQLRRKVYGEEHPVTIKSLDLFTMIYAEMGKLQYSDAVKKLEEPTSSGEKPKAILKKVRFEDEQYKDEEENQKENDDTPQAEDQEASDSEEQEAYQMKNTTSGGESITSKQMLVFLLVTVLIAILITFSFCKYTEHPACPSYSYITERVKFNYYFYIKSFFTKHKYI